MTTVLRRYLVTAAGRQVHYRRAGDGPPLVLVHGFPGSSWTLEPLMEALAGSFTVIAPDLPGYGESDPLVAERPAIGNYAIALDEALDALGIGQCDLYGVHGGAAVALEYAAQQPGRVRRLVLDGLAVLTPEERDERAASLTPPLDPESDGSHWVRLWAMLRNGHIFWPWYRRDMHSRIVADMPSPRELHAEFVDVLKSLPGYGKGIQAELAYDGLTAVQRVTHPALVVARDDDPVAAHLDRITGLPPGVQRLEPLGGLPSLAARISTFCGGDPLPLPPPAPPVLPAVDIVRRTYAQTRIGQVLLRISGGGSGKPLLLFHGSPGTSATLTSLLVAMGQDRPVFAFDTPGLGDSAAPEPGVTMPEIAAIIGDAVDDLGIGEFDVYGSRTGSCTGIELALARPDQVGRVIVDSPVMFEPEFMDWMLQRYLPLLEPDEYGGHLLLAWNFRRDQGLFWPWFHHTAEGVRGRLAFTSDYDELNLTGPARHASLREFIKGGLTYHIPYRAGITYPTRERLPLVTQPVLLCISEHDVFRPGYPEARTGVQRATSRVYPDPGPPEALVVTADLFRRFLDGGDVPLLLGEE